MFLLLVAYQTLVLYSEVVNFKVIMITEDRIQMTDNRIRNKEYGV